MSALATTVPVPAAAGATTLPAAWAIVRCAVLRSSTVALAVTVDGTSGVIEVDLDALGTAADLVAACTAGIAGTTGVPPDDITLVIERGQAGLSIRSGSVDPVQAALLADLVARTAERIATSRRRR